jgi:hypothetical protein
MRPMDLSHLPSILSEAAAIESEMGTQAYWNDEAKRARYRELQTLKGEVTAPAGDDDGGEVLEVFGVSEYAAEHGTTAGYNTYLAATRGAADLLLGMGASDRAAITSSFERLSDNVAGACLQELMSSRPPVDWSDDGDVAYFAGLPEGAFLVAEWGQDARHLHAVVRARLLRVVDALDTEGDVNAFLDWHESLSTGAKIALYRKLAG